MHTQLYVQFNIALYTIASHFLEGTGCPELQDPANGEVTSDGLTATYTCDEGFSLMGDQVRQCSSEGEWSGEEPTCSGQIDLLSLYHDCL